VRLELGSRRKRNFPRRRSTAAFPRNPNSIIHVNTNTNTVTFTYTRFLPSDTCKKEYVVTCYARIPPIWTRETESHEVHFTNEDTRQVTYPAQIALDTPVRQDEDRLLDARLLCRACRSQLTCSVSLP
jgi:hypothetical protein